MSLSASFELVGYGSLPGWNEDCPLDAFDAFCRSAFQVLLKPYRTGSLGVASAAFDEACAAARSAPILDAAAARAFFEVHFAPARLRAEGGGPGFVTGYYEPEVEASLVRTEKFGVPLLTRPADLVDIDDLNRPSGFDPYFAFGRRTASGIEEYPDRRAIESGALDGQVSAIAWLADKVDAFFIHVQGSARLELADGTTRRVTYSAKTGHRFTGAGRVLADLGEIPLANVTMQSIRAWFSVNPHRIDEILRQNRSYIFFRDAGIDDPALGPVGAAKVPLTPGRSIAVDRLLHTFGTPFYIDAPDLKVFDGAPFRRLMIAQDTGSAIVGPARADLFAGSGAAAGEIAGVVRSEADVYALLPRTLVRTSRS